MTRPITTAPADTASAMHAAEMRGQDMQDAPERICITDAECQRRIDAAVLAERDACECEVRRQFRIWEDFGASGFDDLCMAIIPDAIRARGHK